MMSNHTSLLADPKRLYALQSLELMNSPPEDVFDHIAQLAACLCSSSGAGIALVDHARSWFKASIGLATQAREEPLSHSPCTQVILQSDVVEIADMQSDPWSLNSQLSLGVGGARFFAGVPLISELGQPWGVLFVVDRAARTVGLSRHQRESLKNLAVHVVQTARERVRRRRQLRQLTCIEARSHKTYRNLPALLCALNADGSIAEVSDRWLDAFGYLRDKLGKPVPGNLLTDASYALLKNALQHEILHLNNEEGIPLRLQRCDGSIMEMAWTASRERDAGGKLAHTLVVFTDITAHRQIESLLLQPQELATITLRSIGDGVISTDTHLRLQYLNPVAEEITGWTLTEALNRPIDDVFRIINEVTREQAQDPIRCCLQEERTVSLAPNTLLISRSGKEFAIEDTASPIRDLQGCVIGAVLVFHDVSEQRRLQREIVHRSSHDALTGLFNRSEFEIHLQRAFDDLAPVPTEHAMLYLDLDRFKVVNDTSGHAAGDELLRQIAPLMRSKIRRNDVLARLGGDEFGILLLNCGVEQATQIAENLRQAVEEFRFIWGNNIFKIGASIGLIPLSNAHCAVGTLLQAADQACYAAKDRGRNCVQVFLPQDEALARHHSEVRHVARIPTAIEQNSFQLYAQEITPLSDDVDQAMHFEVLLRLRDGVGELILPGAFIPAAERYNRASSIDRWVVMSTLKWLSENRTIVEELGLCAINLSGQSVADEGFQHFVMSQLDACRVDMRKICFEVTETAAVANMSMAARFMQALRARGCQLALDDFGSGLSSFCYLKNLPVDILKIDGMFVRGMINDPVDHALVRSINEIGQMLGKITVAEGVETPALREKLCKLGVNYAQGFNAGRPEPINNLVQRLLARRRLGAAQLAGQLPLD